jgi:hypothetical protein
VSPTIDSHCCYRPGQSLAETSAQALYPVMIENFDDTVADACLLRLTPYFAALLL